MLNQDLSDYAFPDFSLPLTDPVLVFAIVLFIILLTPIILRRFKVPGIIGLIIAGVAIGPHGFYLLERNDAIVLFGTVGMLYIMFVAGVELDLTEFRKYIHRSLLFGVFTFFIPSLLGFPVCYYLLGYDLTASLLISSMFATHTLITYPIVSRLGVSRNEAVAIAVGGTIITDTAVLILLSVITSSVTGKLDFEFWQRLIASIAVFILVIVFLFPVVARWFFKNIEGEKSSQYIFVLAMVFLAAFLAKLAGLEPIVGAFLAGLALNRLIPHTSPLMNRIEFAGNALFIPFFLISVGMLVDFRVLLKGPQAILVAVSLTITAISGKWLAAFLTQHLFRYNSDQRNLIFGLSNSHAAATLAVIMIGYDLKLFDESVLNGTIILILFTCLIASFVTENAARKIALEEVTVLDPIQILDERILVSLSNPSTVEAMIELAIMMKKPISMQPIYVLAIVKDDNEAIEKVMRSNKMLESAIKQGAATDTQVQVITRVDINEASGIMHVIKEMKINTVIIRWSERSGSTGLIFGTLLDNLLNHSRQMFLVCNVQIPLNLIKRVVVVVAEHTELEVGFQRWVMTVMSFMKHSRAEIKMWSSQKTGTAFRDVINNYSGKIRYEKLADSSDYLHLLQDLETDDLLVVVSARKGTISYEKSINEVPVILLKQSPKSSFIIIYPEQNPVNTENLYVTQAPHFIL